MSSFKDLASTMINQMLTEVAENIRTGVRKYHPPQILDYIEYQCTEAHTRVGQDIHGTINFTAGQIIQMRAETVVEHGYVIELAKFKRLSGIKYILRK